MTTSPPTEGKQFRSSVISMFIFMLVLGLPVTFCLLLASYSGPDCPYTYVYWWSITDFLTHRRLDEFHFLSHDHFRRRSHDSVFYGRRTFCPMARYSEGPDAPVPQPEMDSGLSGR